MEAHYNSKIYKKNYAQQILVYNEKILLLVFKT